MVYKKFEIIGVIFETLVGSFLMVLGTMLAFVCIENMLLQEDLKAFIDESVYEETVEVKMNRRNYQIELYANYTDEVIEDTVFIGENSVELGNTGDFFIMPQSRMNVLPYSEEFIGFLFGGHAGLLYHNDDHTSSIEAMGGTAEEAYVLAYNYADLWELYDKRPRTVIGMRVKSTIETRMDAILYAAHLIDKDYSYNYLIHKKDAYYCTDLISRVYGEESGLNFNLDENGFYTSTQDLYFSKDSMLTFIKIHDSDDKIRIYYLKSRSL